MDQRKYSRPHGPTVTPHDVRGIGVPFKNCEKRQLQNINNLQFLLLTSTRKKQCSDNGHISIKS